MRSVFRLTVCLLLVAATAPLAYGQELTGSISGQVVLADSEDFFIVTIQVYDESETVVGEVTGTPYGDYQIDGLPPGTYKIPIVNNCDFHYQDQWFDRKADEASADPVTVVAGETTEISVFLQLPTDPGGWISGTVTDSSSGLPLDGTCVTPYNPDEQPYQPVVESLFTQPAVPPAHGLSASDGTYRLGFLGTGDFRLEFADCTGFSYLPKWWSNAADFSTAGVVSVVEGWEVGGIDIALDLEPGRPPRAVPAEPDPNELPFTGDIARLLAVLAGALVAGGGLMLALSRPE